LALGCVLVALTILLLAWSERRATPGIAEAVGVPGTRIVVFKGPACSCCDRWETHLEMAGFQVESRTIDDLHAKRRELDVPPSHRSCHTAVVDGYFIEGHVPADVIIRMLKTRPQLAGLVVPGMPFGSPGMTNGPALPFEVYAVDAAGKITLYATR
jgi:hypothetical protein